MDNKTQLISSRVSAVQKQYGEAEATRLGSLPTGNLSIWINGNEIIDETFGRLTTDEERKAFFDEFLRVQRRDFGSAWCAIYQTIDLIRQNDWYWSDLGYKNFEDFWKNEGEVLFGQWAELESVYQYAHLAAPELFKIDFDKARILVSSLKGFIKEDTPKKDPSQEKQIVKTSEYIPELNSQEWQAGFSQGKNTLSKDKFKRFGRLRRFNPQVANEFLAGKFLKTLKNGKIKPDLISAEIAAGIRKKEQVNKKGDDLIQCKKITKTMSKVKLENLKIHIEKLLKLHNTFYSKEI